MKLSDEALDAGAKALDAHFAQFISGASYFECACGHDVQSDISLMRRHMVEAIAEAMVPFIGAQIAADIRAVKSQGGHLPVGRIAFNLAIEHGARIAEKGGET